MDQILLHLKEIYPLLSEGDIVKLCLSTFYTHHKKLEGVFMREAVLHTPYTRMNGTVNSDRYNEKHVPGQTELDSIEVKKLTPKKRSAYLSGEIKKISSDYEVLEDYDDIIDDERI